MAAIRSDERVPKIRALSTGARSPSHAKPIPRCNGTVGHVEMNWPRDYVTGRGKDHAMTEPTMDDKTRTELEAAVFRRLVEHLRTRTDVQNIDLMNLAGFCRNCLSNWMKEAADEKGLPLSKDQSREQVYGMPYDEWRAKYQKEASAEQKAAFEKSHSH
jgi:hypothetical protein